MKVIILAGGYGTRLGEITNKIPKPMVEIGGIPIIVHIMNIYAYYGHTDFYIALGYKADYIEDYFKNFKTNWNINLIDTGLDTLTGGRCKIISEHINNETCFLTYGDGLSNININNLLNFHNKHGRKITISAVHPTARFGELELDGDIVLSFIEKTSAPKRMDKWRLYRMSHLFLITSQMILCWKESQSREQLKNLKCAHINMRDFGNAWILKETRSY